MDFNFTDGEHTFSHEVRRWLERNLPRDLRGRGFAVSHADPTRGARRRAWPRTMSEAGYVGMEWPREYGGRGDQELVQMATEIIGPYSQIAGGSPWTPDEGAWESDTSLAQSSTIRAGTTEILRNILAERVLGRPKD